MSILFLLIPLSVILVAAIGVVLFWAVHNGQFEIADEEGQTIINDDDNNNPRKD